MTADSSWWTVALVWLPAFSAFVSFVALVMTRVNLGVYGRAAPRPAASVSVGASGAGPVLTICIPARNEERNVDAVVRGALANADVPLEVLVYDDQSSDRTPAILAALRGEDARVRAVTTEPLPAGWNGKQWGCERMGQAAQGQWLLFTDADVRFTPDCFARALAEAARLDAALLSTIPREETGTFLERLVVPMIHWMLFSWLPMPRMRATNDPATSAGCGQFLLVRRDAWLAAGGHAAFRDSMHDGIKLPRNVRRAGFHTDLYDGSDTVSCRMYRSAGETWRGFTKNAYEGLGSPVVLVVFTVLEAFGILLPWIWLPVMLLVRGTESMPTVPTGLASFAIGAQIAQRRMLAKRFSQPWECWVLHPVTIVLLLAIQWRSWWLHLTKRRAWRGRTAG
jgi:glycosyltransferase involved in cell wall biosynthesis